MKHLKSGLFNKQAHYKITTGINTVVSFARKVVVLIPVKLIEMRQIRFRIWDNKYNEYAEEPDHRWTISRSGKLYNSENDEWYENSDIFIIEQFTGLTDKNGKEIYEGDIVKDYNCDFIDDKSEVVFHNGYYYPLVQHEEGYNCISGYSPERFEVIGNLHEHPDLISS